MHDLPCVLLTGYFHHSETGESPGSKHRQGYRVSRSERCAPSDPRANPDRACACGAGTSRRCRSIHRRRVTPGHVGKRDRRTKEFNTVHRRSSALAGITFQCVLGVAPCNPQILITEGPSAHPAYLCNMRVDGLAAMAQMPCSGASCCRRMHH